MGGDPIEVVSDVTLGLVEARDGDGRLHVEGRRREHAIDDRLGDLVPFFEVLRQRLEEGLANRRCLKDDLTGSRKLHPGTSTGRPVEHAHHARVDLAAGRVRVALEDDPVDGFEDRGLLSLDAVHVVAGRGDGESIHRLPTHARVGEEEVGILDHDIRGRRAEVLEELRDQSLRELLLSEQVDQSGVRGRVDLWVFFEVCFDVRDDLLVDPGDLQESLGSRPEDLQSLLAECLRDRLRLDRSKPVDVRG